MTSPVVALKYPVPPRPERKLLSTFRILSCQKKKKEKKCNEGRESLREGWGEEEGEEGTHRHTQTHTDTQTHTHTHID